MKSEFSTTILAIGMVVAGCSDRVSDDPRFQQTLANAEDEAAGRHGDSEYERSMGRLRQKWLAKIADQGHVPTELLAVTAFADRGVLFVEWGGDRPAADGIVLQADGTEFDFRTFWSRIKPGTLEKQRLSGFLTTPDCRRQRRNPVRTRQRHVDSHALCTPEKCESRTEAATILFDDAIKDHNEEASEHIIAYTVPVLAAKEHPDTWRWLLSLEAPVRAQLVSKGTRLANEVRIDMRNQPGQESTKAETGSARSESVPQ